MTTQHLQRPLQKTYIQIPKLLKRDTEIIKIQKYVKT